MPRDLMRLLCRVVAGRASDEGAFDRRLGEVGEPQGRLLLGRSYPMLARIHADKSLPLGDATGVDDLGLALDATRHLEAVHKSRQPQILRIDQQSHIQRVRSVADLATAEPTVAAVVVPVVVRVVVETLRLSITLRSDADRDLGLLRSHRH